MTTPADQRAFTIEPPSSSGINMIILKFTSVSLLACVGWSRSKHPYISRSGALRTHLQHDVFIFSRDQWTGNNAIAYFDSTCLVSPSLADVLLLLGHRHLAMRRPIYAIGDLQSFTIFHIYDGSLGTVVAAAVPGSLRALPCAWINFTLLSLF